MMREIIRCYLAPHVVPTLGYSSFEAWRGLPAVDTPDRKRETDNPTIAGFLAAGFFAAATCLARAIARAVYSATPAEGDVLPTWRSREQPERGASRYLEQLDAIWDLQSFLLNMADRAQVPVIANWTIEHTVRDIMQQVSLRIKERYPPHTGILDRV